MLRRPRRHLFLGTTALLPVVLADMASAQSLAPLAAPSGGRVSSGTATIAQTPGLTQITQSSNRAAIDWQRFDVGPNQQVNFQQPSSSAWTLNRVTSPDPSVIAGRITANGGVALVNQSGVVFAAGSQVNVASLIASGANITNENFMAGKMVFNGPPRPGARIENRGTITVAQRGMAALVGPEVANKGVIRAQMGRVALAGAETYTLDLAGDGLLSIDVTRSVQHNPNGATVLVTNSGTIDAAGGSVLLSADAASGLVETLVANTGRISAPTIAASAGAPARTGTIAMRATGGGVQLDGTLAVRGGPNAIGGSVQITGDGAVTLTGAARINASGGTGGGRILVGTTGVGSNQRLAAHTTVASGARLRADAARNGKGGTIAVNSSTETVFRGSASARGGLGGGDGGMVEISGQGALTLAGTVDVQAPAGQNGTLLLDPQDITVVRTATTDPVQVGNGTVLAGSAPANGNLQISSSSIQNFAGTVRLEATRNVTVSNPIGKSNGGLQFLAQTSQVNLLQPVVATGDITITGGTISVASALGTAGKLTLTSTQAQVGILSTATLAGGTGVMIRSQTDVSNSGAIYGGYVPTLPAFLVGPLAGVTVAGTTGNAVQVTALGSVSNDGTISGKGGGAALTLGGTASAIFIQAQGDISNTGTIAALARADGTGGWIRLDTAGVNTSFNNNQAIAGGSISNVAGGTLTADHAVDLTAYAAVTNSGTISGDRVTLSALGTGLTEPPAILLSSGSVMATGTPTAASPNLGTVSVTAANNDIQQTGGATVTATSNVSMAAANGGIVFDGASITAGGTVQIAATANNLGSETGSIRFDSVTVNAETLIARVDPTTGTLINLDSATFNLGRGMLLAAPGGITTDALATVRPLDPARQPVVVIDTRRTNALTALPDAAQPDTATAQPTQLSGFGSATANPAGDVPFLEMDAGQSPVFMLLDSGRVSGTLTAGRLGIVGLQGAADLSGTLGTQSDAGAATLASVSPQASASGGQAYLFNGCVFASTSCQFVPPPVLPVGPGTETGTSTVPSATTPATVASAVRLVPTNIQNVLGNIAAAVNASNSLHNLLVPQPEIVRFRPLRGRLADPDVMLPNVVEQDY